jgi:EF hand
MHKRVLMLMTSALVLAYGGFSAIAQDRMTPQPDQQHTQHHPTGQESAGTSGQADMMDCGMMGQGGMMGPGTMGMMGRGMMGGGMMGGGAMGPPIMMRMIFSLMDSDGDGTISLQEFQAAHERIFKGMDSNKDGRLTQEEMRAFMQGTRRSVPLQ